MKYLLQQSIFVIRFRYISAIASAIRKLWLTSCGMKIGKGTMLPQLFVTWPHQVVIGSKCVLEHAIHFKFDGIWQTGPSIFIGDGTFIGSGSEFNIRKMITIGNDVLIASGCKFIDHDHGYKTGQLIRTQACPSTAIEIGNDVWLGFNVTVLKGVIIGDGAIVAAGAVVNKSILPGEIWAGIPAKKIGDRK